MSTKHLRGGDKLEQYWSSIRSEKLDTLRYSMLHSGIQCAAVQNDAGQTGVALAASEGRAKALLVMCDIFRQQRVPIAEGVDLPDEEGRTPLMLAAAKGHAKCCDHLLYYGASRTAVSSAGRTARDYALAHRQKEVIELFDEEDAADAAPAVTEVVDADGLTSTQRSKAKKRALQEAEQRGMLAAAPARFCWSEVAIAATDKRRELRIDHHPSADAAASSAAAAVVAPPAGGAAAAAAAAAAAPPPLDPLPSGSLIDPALWHCSLLNRLELHVPGLPSLPPLVGHLSALQTLIVSGCGLATLPDTLACCVELKFLDLRANALTCLPLTLKALKRLEVVDVSDNRLTELGPLSDLTTLTTLLADRNALESCTLSWGSLSRLELLSLSANKLTSLPDDIGLLQQLAVLNIADNALTALPSGMADLKEKKIRDLRLLPNPLEDKKVLKVLAKEDRVEMVKELFKLLKKGGGGKKK